MDEFVLSVFGILREATAFVGGIISPHEAHSGDFRPAVGYLLMLGARMPGPLEIKPLVASSILYFILLPSLPGTNLTTHSWMVQPPEASLQVPVAWLTFRGFERAAHTEASCARVERDGRLSTARAAGGQ